MSNRSAMPLRPLASCLLAAGLLWLAPAIPAQATPGNLDPSFSGDGTLITDFEPGRISDPGGVALQADGKVVAGGSASDFMALSSMALVRFNRDGSLDTSFSDDGRQTVRFGEFDYGADVAIQPDGRILLFGFGGNGGEHDFALARFNLDGSLDPTFSGDGKQTIDFGGDEQIVAGGGGLALQPDGKILAVGSGGRIGPNDFASVRLNPDGSPDLTFSGDGKQTTDFGRNEEAAAAVVQADGKIVVAGRTRTDGPDPSQLPSAFALARYNPNGSLDPTFSGDGKQTTEFGSLTEASAVAVQPDGKLLAAGSYSLPAGTTSALYFALARYNPDGSLDASFSGDGKLETGGLGYGAALALQRDGKVVAAGGDTGFTLARYNADGTSDPGFACQGRQRTALDGRATSVALYPDGGILATGAGGGGYRDSDLALIRYLGDSDPFPPRARLVLKRTQRLRTLRRTGLRFEVKADEAPRIRAGLEISRRLARRLGLVRGGKARGRKPVTIGRGSASRPSACTHTRSARVRLTRNARRQLRGARGVRATLRIRVSDKAGNGTRIARRIRFR